MSLLGGCHFELLSDLWFGLRCPILGNWTIYWRDGGWMVGWMERQLMAKRWKFWFSASQIVIHNAKRKCGIQREFMWFLHNWRQKMQSMHWCTQCWCTEWWCICREAEKSFGTNLSPFPPSLMPGASIQNLLGNVSEQSLLSNFPAQIEGLEMLGAL